MNRNELRRFFSHVKKDRKAGCWLWTGCVTDGGYGHMGFRGKVVTAHRLAYRQFVGPIPEGMQTDHLCHTRDESCPGGVTCKHRRCVNPAHLELVTSKENSRRGKHRSAVAVRSGYCQRGHRLIGENLVVHKTTGYRQCKKCARAAGATNSRKHRQQNPEKFNAYSSAWKKAKVRELRTPLREALATLLAGQSGFLSTLEIIAMLKLQSPEFDPTPRAVGDCLNEMGIQRKRTSAVKGWLC